MPLPLMGRRRWLPIFIAAAIATTVFVSLLFYTLLQYPDQPWTISGAVSENTYKSLEHTLGVVVPFRDRFDELMIFVPYMTEYLSKKFINHRFYIVNQVDSYRFNRASLINVGYLLARQDGCTYIAMHDVDLLPNNSQLPYGFPSQGPMHVAAPNLHPLYHYDKYIGGILLISNYHFEKVNGMTNIFWGWGREDDELYVRLKQSKLTISRPTNITTGLKTFYHIHDRNRRKRDYAFYYNQKQLTKRRDYITGLNDLKYELVSRRLLSVDGFSCTVYNVKLHCDVTFTPYCQEPKPPPRANKRLNRQSNSSIPR